MAVAKLRGEHDALIAKAKADPAEKTILRREKDRRRDELLSRDIAKDREYRKRVMSGEVDDPEEITTAEYERYWLRTDDFLDVT